MDEGHTRTCAAVTLVAVIGSLAHPTTAMAQSQDDAECPLDDDVAGERAGARREVRGARHAAPRRLVRDPVADLLHARRDARVRAGARRSGRGGHADERSSLHARVPQASSDSIIWPSGWIRAPSEVALLRMSRYLRRALFVDLLHGSIGD
jgi:hypothetical protein